VFTLRIEFTGLCLYVFHPDEDKVAVVLPDCRDTGTLIKYPHDDGDTKCDPHAGYMELESAAFGCAFPSNAFDVVHLLEQHELYICAGTAGMLSKADVHVPSFDGQDETSKVKHFDALVLRTDVFDDANTGVLARIVLRGGKFLPVAGSKSWTIPGTLNASKVDQIGYFAGQVVWETDIDGGDVTLCIRKFGSRLAEATRVVLKPRQEERRKVVHIKIANLCAHNPLEWDAFNPVEVTQDVDFKWLYRLLESNSGETLADRLKNAGNAQLPYPVITPGPENRGNEDCMGAKITVSF
jgi:hypothetical protein